MHGKLCHQLKNESVGMNGKNFKAAINGSGSFSNKSKNNVL